MQYGKSQEAIDRLTAEQRRRAPNARSPGNTTIIRSLASTWTSPQASLSLRRRVIQAILLGRNMQPTTGSESMNRTPAKSP